MKNPVKFSPTADDDIILLETYQNDIIDSDSLCGLLPHRAPASLKVRIRLLAEKGFLDELKQTLYRAGGGSFSKRYRLGDAGAKRLKGLYGELPIPITRWKTKNKSLTKEHIFHTLKESAFLCQLRGSISKRDDIEYYFPHAIFKALKPELLNKKELPTVLKTEVDWFGHREVEGTKYDIFGMLKYLKNPEGKQHRFLFVEIDMGTETINPSDRVMKGKRNFWRGSSIMRKWVIYGQGFRNESHRKIFGIPTFQVLHITTTPERVQEMITSYQERLKNTVAPARFLFTDFQTIKKYNGDILEIPIFNGAGKTMRLGDTLVRE